METRHTVIGIAALTSVGSIYSALEVSSFAASLPVYPLGLSDQTFKVEALRSVLSGSRCWLFASSVMGLVGFYGVYKTHLPSIRTFALFSVSNLAASFLATALFALVSFSPSLSADFSRVLCEEISRSEDMDSRMGFSLGNWGVEACEESWHAVATFLVAFCSLFLLVQGRAAMLVWQYYIALRRLPRQSRQHAYSPIPKRSTRSPSLSDQPYSDHYPLKPRSQSFHTRQRSCSEETVQASKPSQRILVLPQSYNTTESRRRHSLPSNTKNVTVYTPVLMSLEEATTLGAVQGVVESPFSSDEEDVPTPKGNESANFKILKG